LPLCWHSDQWHQWRSHAWSGIKTLCTWYSTLCGALLQSCGTNAMFQKTTLVLYSYVWWTFRRQGGFWSKHLWVFFIRASDVPTSIHSLLKMLRLFVCFTVGVPSWTCSWYFSSWPAMGSSVYPRGTFEDASEHYWSCVARKQLTKESKMWWMWIHFTITYPFCFSCQWIMSPTFDCKICGPFGVV
jgi:hypothetical protein